MVGFLLGAVAGIVQFWVLTKFAGLISSGDMSAKAVLFGLLQFFIPFIVLVCVAFIWKAFLIWTATGIVAALIVGIVVKYAVLPHINKGREEKDA